MKSKKIVIVHELSDEDKKFVSDISNEFEVPVDKMELCISDLLNVTEQLAKGFRSFDLIGKIDYKGELTFRESDALKSLSWVIVAHVNDNLPITKFRKFIIAGLILIHFKIDKYERIKTKEEYEKDPTESSQDYKHYLYDRMKSRFKRLEKFK